MTPGALLDDLARQGIRLFVRDGFLKYRAPAGAYTDALRAEVAEHRMTLLREWRCMLCGVIVDVLFGIQPMILCRSCAREERA